MAVRRGLTCFAMLVVLLRETDVRAQSKNDALAESLFKEGRALLDKGRVAEGCAKLEESARIDAASGTVLSVADCHEKLGRTASAWADYKSALELAQRAGRADRVAFAKKKVQELEPKVPHLVLSPPSPAIPGLTVRIDGTDLTSSALGTPLALDEGVYAIDAAAPGYEPFKIQVTLTTGNQTTATLGPFVPLPVEQAPAPKAKWPIPVAIAAGTLSLLSFVVAAGTGARAIDLGAVVASECPNGQCSELGWSSYQDGDTLATASNVTVGVGIGLAAVAATFVVLAIVGVPDDPSQVPVSARNGGLEIAF